MNTPTNSELVQKFFAGQLTKEELANLDFTQLQDEIAAFAMSSKPSAASVAAPNDPISYEDLEAYVDNTSSESMRTTIASRAQEDKGLAMEIEAMQDAKAHLALHGQKTTTEVMKPAWWTFLSSASLRYSVGAAAIAVLGFVMLKEYKPAAHSVVLDGQGSKVAIKDLRPPATGPEAQTPTGATASKPAAGEADKPGRTKAAPSGAPPASAPDLGPGAAVSDVDSPKPKGTIPRGLVARGPDGLALGSTPPAKGRRPAKIDATFHDGSRILALSGAIAFSSGDNGKTYDPTSAELADALVGMDIKVGEGDKIRKDIPGPSGDIHPLSSSRAVVSSLSPTLAWTAVSGARNYEVSIYSDQSRLAGAHAVGATSWQVPPGTLKNGSLYRWMVHANDGKGTVLGSLEASFTTPTEAELGKLPSIAKMPPLKRAIEYTRIGQFELGEKAVKSFVEQNNSVDGIQNLLRNYHEAYGPR